MLPAAFWWCEETENVIRLLTSDGLLPLMPDPDLTVEAAALTQAKELGLEADDLQVELLRMARLATMLTHVDGNRRYRSWWLRVENGRVTAVGQLGEDEIEQMGKVMHRRGARARAFRALALHRDRNSRE